MNKKLRLDRLHIFIILFLILFVCSGAFLVFRRQGPADGFSVISLFLLIVWLLYAPAQAVVCGFVRGGRWLIYRLTGLSMAGLLAVIALFYCFFLFVHFDKPKGVYFSPPGVYGGDEEHNLIMINSLIKDYDLELKNNYQNAKEGGYDAGSAWRSRILDHHSVYVHKETKRMVHFWQIVDVGPTVSQWVIKIPKLYNDLDNYLERPHHPPGMPFVFALLLFPLAGWEYIEAVALLLMVVISIIGLVCLYKILSAIGEDKKGINIVLFLTAIASPVCYYSILLFKEVFLAAILAAICWLYFFKRQGFFSGVLVVLGFFTRYSFPVIIIPLVLYGVLKRRWRQMFTFLLTLASGAGGLLLYNFYMYGGILKFSQPWAFGKWLTLRYILSIFGLVPLIILILVFCIKFIFNRQFIKSHFRMVRAAIWIAGVVLLVLVSMRYPATKRSFIDLKSGLLPFSPVLIFSIWMMLDIETWRDNRVAGILGVIIVYFGIYGVKGFGVGSAFACRQIVPVVPLMAVPLYYWVKTYRNRLALTLFSVLAVYSFIISFLAVFAQRYFWHLPLNTALIQLFNDIF